MANKLAHIVVEGNTYDIQDEELTNKFDGMTIELSLSNDYVITATLKDGNDITLNTSTIDLPIKNSIVSLRYDTTTNEIIGIYRDDTVAVPHRIRVALSNLQEKLTAGQNISITNNTVSLLGLGEASTETVTGIATLDNSGKVPSSQLPSFVDDVLEYDSIQDFPGTGETGKIYVDKTTNLTYRWSGSVYVEISKSLALGETSSTAYRGDRGKTAYDHAIAKGSAYQSGLYKITTNSEGHVTSATVVQKSDITALDIPAQDTTYNSGVATEIDNNNNVNVKYDSDTLEVDSQNRLKVKSSSQTFNFNEAIENVNGTVNVRYKGGNWNIGRDTTTNQLTINGKFVKQVEDLYAYTNAPEGEIVEYIGETNSSYTNGYFYKRITGTSYNIPSGSAFFNIPSDISTDEFSILQGTYYVIQQIDDITVNAFAYKTINNQQVSWITYYNYTNQNDTVDHIGDKIVWEDGKITTITSLSVGYASQDNEGNSLLNANRSYLQNTVVYLCVNQYGDIVYIASDSSLSYLQGSIVDDRYAAWNSLVFSLNTVFKQTTTEQITINTDSWQRIDVQPNVSLTDYYTKTETDAAIGKGAILFQKNGQDITLTGSPNIVDNKTVFGANQSGNTICNIIVPTQTSELINNSGFITKAVNDLSYYYTKDVIDTMIAPNLRFAVVQSLPTENISGTTIYLVPKSQSDNQNVYDEYVYIATVATPHWERIGDTTVDLSNYYTKTQADTNFAAKSHTHTASQISGLTDTGATSVIVTGSGNAVTSSSYSAANRKITLTKGITTLVAGTEGETAISSGDDLNDYYEIGTYGTSGGNGNSTIANSLLNKPTFDGGFRLYVESCGGNSDYRRQTIITKNGLTFVRTSTNSSSPYTWTTWEKVISANPNSTVTKYLRADGTWQVPQDTNTTYTFETGDANGQIKVTPSGGTAQNVNVKGLDSAAYTDKQNYWMIGRTSTSIPASSTNTVDLNTYVTPGNYYCGKNADAAFVTNHPSPSSHPAFNLIVLSGVNSSTYIRQIVLCHSTTDLWMRYSTDTGATWTTWRNLASDTKIYYLNVGTMITFVIADGEPALSYNEPYPFNRTISIATDKNLRNYEVIGLLLNQTPQKVTFNWRASISQDEISLTFNGIYIRVQGSPPQGSIAGKLVLIKKSEFYDLQDFVSITPHPVTITL